MRFQVTPSISAIRSAVLGVSFVCLLVQPMEAQAQQWGVGMYGANQACSYGQGMPQEAAPQRNDELSGLRSAQSEMKKEKRELERKLRNLENKKDKYAEAISETVKSDWAEAVVAHMENGYNCLCERADASQPHPRPQRPMGKPGGMRAQPPPGEFDLPVGGAEVSQNPYDQGWMTVNAGQFESSSAAHFCAPRDPLHSSQPWRSICRDGGGISKDICQNNFFTLSEVKREVRRTCGEAIDNFRKITKSTEQLRNKISKLDERIQEFAETIGDRRRDRKGESEFEAGCPSGECYRPRQSAEAKSSNWSTLLPLVAGVVGGGIAEYFGYKANKANNENLNKMGWPTQSYQFGSYGYPFFQAGLYGSIAAGQNGAFGCSPGYFGGGMNGTMAGGMMSPYGMNGMMNPYAMMSPFGYPGMGAMGNTLGGGMYMPGTAMNMMTSGYGAQNGWGTLYGYGPIPGLSGYYGGTNISSVPSYGYGGLPGISSSYTPFVAAYGGFSTPTSLTTPYNVQFGYQQNLIGQYNSLLYRVNQFNSGSSSYGLGVYPYSLGAR